jgi:hypothetical protein
MPALPQIQLWSSLLEIIPAPATLILPRRQYL